MRKGRPEYIGGSKNHVRPGRFVRLAFLSAVLTGAMALTGYGAETEGELPDRDIVILVTSDVHCGIEQNFGYAGLSQIRDTFEKNGDATLLVDDGDSVQGEVIGMVTKGESVIDLMNALDYDVAIPGNHEFDYGMDQFMKLTDAAQFPYICCNFRKEGEPVFDAWHICDVDGTKIGFVGVTTPTTVYTSTPVYFQDADGNYIYDFMEQDKTGEELYTAVQEAVDAVRAEGAEYVFVMAHLGNEAECSPWTYADVISHISGIDGFLDGHSHDTDQVTMKDKNGNEVFRMAVGTKMNSIGCVRISAEDGSISHDLYTWSNSVSLPQLTGIENEITKAIDTELNELKEEMGVVIAKTPFDLLIHDPEAVDENGLPIRIVRMAETNLGDLCADGLLTAARSDVAIFNGGGIRDDVLAGEISYLNVLDVQPFGNTMSVVEATGQQILDALEWGARMVPNENGGFLQVAGMSYEIHTYLKDSCEQDEHGAFAGVSGEYRVKNVKIGGEPLDPEKTYTIAGNNYMLFENGDGYTMFDGCKVVRKNFMLDNEVLADYLQDTLGGVVPETYADPYGEGRIVAVDEPEEESASSS